MQAMQLTGLRQMELRTVPDPQIRRPDEVLLRIRAVGVCGSDVHYYTQGRIGSQVVSYPFAVGHEAAGVVEAVGPAVRQLKPGDRVAIDPPVSCHACDQCQAGRHHTCRRLQYLGCPGQLEGCLGELLVMPEECCFPVPASLSFAEAALIEPLSIGVYAVRQSIPMQGAKVGILGAGPIGVSVMLPALAAGAAMGSVTYTAAARAGLPPWRLLGRRPGAGGRGPGDQCPRAAPAGCRLRVLRSAVSAGPGLGLAQARRETHDHRHPRVRALQLRRRNRPPS